jgi:phospholipid/cholesterol/gamma-HCH transport system substrate-binding protein
LGAFIFSTLIALAIGIFLIGDKQFLFSSTYGLKASFKNVAGLAGGAEVRVGGIHKGTVKQIQLPTQAEGEMTVLMNMEGSTRKVLKKDSVASIQTEGLLGNKYMEISFGSANAPAVEDGDTLESVPPLDMSDLLKKTNEILDSTKDSMGALQSISEKINDGQGTMGKLVNDKKIYEQMNAATAQAKLGAAAFQENMQALKHNWFLRGFFNRRGYEDATKLAQYEIARLPDKQPLKKFVFDAKQIFDQPDSAKLKNYKALNDAGRSLEQNPFGLAVVVAYNGMKGDAEETRVLTQGRALVVRDYLVENFKMDDTRFKTLGLGKQEQKDAGEAGKVEILIYPDGTGAPPAAVAANSSR